MRKTFDEQLDLLSQELTHMGALCETAIASATEALKKRDVDLAKHAIAADQEIDQQEREIERLCLKLLLQQQPVAKDLRVISAALKMISDMERIGDQAADIAELTGYVADTIQQQNRLHITKMARAAVGMVTESIEAFVQGDLQLVQKVIRDDDAVDELFLRVRQELVQALKDESGKPNAILDLLMIAKYFERIGDHAVNVAEWVEYSITGVHKSSEHHQES